MKRLLLSICGLLLAAGNAFAAMQTGIQSPPLADSALGAPDVMDPVVTRLIDSSWAKSSRGFVHPIWSPDDKCIAITQGRSVHGIWLLSSDGRSLEQLTDDQTWGRTIAWSPDSRYIAYRAEKMVRGKRYFAIKVVNVKDKKDSLIMDFSRYWGAPRWVSPLGTIAFEVDRNGSLNRKHAADLKPSQAKTQAFDLFVGTSDMKVWVSHVDGSDRILVSGPDERCYGAILSPDGHRHGHRLCYGSSMHGGSISVVNTDGSGRVNLGRGSSPCWSPDGLRLAYQITEDDGHYLTGSDLYIIGVDGEGRVQLTNTPDILEERPSWSPDGRRIAFSAGGAIYAMSLPGSAQSTFRQGME